MRLGRILVGSLLLPMFATTATAANVRPAIKPVAAAAVAQPQAPFRAAEEVDAADASEMFGAGIPVAAIIAAVVLVVIGVVVIADDDESSPA